MNLLQVTDVDQVQEKLENLMKEVIEKKVRK